MHNKNSIDELALFGGTPLFHTPKSTSNLLQPDFDRFMDYSTLFLQANHYINGGPAVSLLEQRLADFHHAAHCITVCSGFWGLALTIRALAIPGKSEIIMPSLTYRRMPDVAAWVNLKPRFCEVDAATLAMTAETVEPHLNENTALILAPHPIVNQCDVQGLLTLTQARQIPLLFDAVESVYEGTALGKVGSLGQAEVFSIHACKLINGFGGGYITTNDDALSRQLRTLRNQGLDEHGKLTACAGMNAHLNEMHAAMALASLDDVDQQVLRNQQRYRTYQTRLAGLPGIRLLAFDESCPTGYKNIVVELLDDWPLTRQMTLQVLNAEKILARAYYWPALHQKDMLFPHIPAHLPITDALAEKFVNLPCGHLVDTQDIEKIVDFMQFIFNHAKQIVQRTQTAGQA